MSKPVGPRRFQVGSPDPGCGSDIPAGRAGGDSLKLTAPCDGDVGDNQDRRKVMDAETTETTWLDADELGVFRAFQCAGVRFLIVGGRAVQFHGYPRPAKDLDLLVEPSAENWPKLQAALRTLNATVPRFEELSPHRRYRAKLRFYETVELLTAISNVSFTEAWTGCIETDYEGIQVRVLSKAHLIFSKQHSRRPADADDIHRLQVLSPREGSL